MNCVTGMVRLYDTFVSQIIIIKQFYENDEEFNLCGGSTIFI